MNIKGTKEGIVKNNIHATNGTLLVEVKSQKYDTFFRKIIVSKRMYTVHYEPKKHIAVNTKVTIATCRPISKTKTYTVIGESTC